MTARIDPTEFAGKRVLVSGGSKGLGRATVARFLSGGARVITAARPNRWSRIHRRRPDNDRRGRSLCQSGDRTLWRH